ncbi:hypothetical protein NDU88_002339 [Pleurodeles waltl]|uniref:Uncharacterized protein n=1 Tax=Pleurodeles waltl TaxID=8319 RepID=A0AAV7M247_PLEWA|nr:hypothetical protein NDU88_002339 [Pleurodeles waltl]
MSRTPRHDVSSSGPARQHTPAPFRLLTGDSCRSHQALHWLPAIQGSTREEENPTLGAKAGERPLPQINAFGSPDPRAFQGTPPCSGIKPQTMGPCRSDTLRAPFRDARGMPNIKGTPGLGQDSAGMEGAH